MAPLALRIAPCFYECRKSGSVLQICGVSLPVARCMRVSVERSWEGINALLQSTQSKLVEVERDHKAYQADALRSQDDDTQIQMCIMVSSLFLLIEDLAKQVSSLSQDLRECDEHLAQLDFYIQSTREGSELPILEIVEDDVRL
jgi:hypothetical protein